MLESIIFQLVTSYAPLIMFVAIIVLALKFKSPLLWTMAFGHLLVLVGNWAPVYLFDSFSNTSYNEAGELISMDEPTVWFELMQYLQWFGILLSVGAFLLFSLLVKPFKNSKK